jgi:hypothetical protein
MIEPLSTEESIALDEGLAFATRIALQSGASRAAKRPFTVELVQALYDRYLDDEIDDVDATIALGLAFGETIVAKSGFEWVRVTDELGSETCISPEGKDLHCAPVSMIQKRLRRRERVSIASMRDGIIALILERLDQAGDRKVSWQ